MSKILIVEVARGGRNSFGHRMGGWKIMTGGIPVARMRKAKDARRFAKNLRKLYARKNMDPAAAAAVFAVGQMKDDNDLHEMDRDLNYEREEAFPVEG